MHFSCEVPTSYGSDIFSTDVTTFLRQCECRIVGALTTVQLFIHFCVITTVLFAFTQPSVPIHNHTDVTCPVS